jgi:hypothetical protein
MNHFVLIAVLFSGLSAFAQAGFETVIPAEPLGDALHIDQNYASVQGHWVPLDEHSKLAGPSVSTISCDHNQGTCEEEEGNIAVIGNSFSLSADHVEYKIERWTAKEIVAANVGGVCRVRSVIKIDITTKRVYSSQTLSEPVDDKLPQLSKDMCNLVGMNIELKSSTLWVKKMTTSTGPTSTQEWKLSNVRVPNEQVHLIRA